jgi:hypothetical protein
VVQEFFIPEAGRRRTRRRRKKREIESALLSSFAFGIVILGSDFVPIHTEREGGGLGFLSPLFSSPLLPSQPLLLPRLTGRRLGSGDSNPCRLAMLPTRSTPSGPPPFSYCLINRLRIIGSSLPPVGCSTSSGDREFFSAHIPRLHDSARLLGLSLFSAFLELWLVRPRWVQPILFRSHGCCYDPNDWLVSSRLYAACARAQGFPDP